MRCCRQPQQSCRRQLHLRLWLLMTGPRLSRYALQAAPGMKVSLELHDLQLCQAFHNLLAHLNKCT